MQHFSLLALISAVAITACATDTTPQSTTNSGLAVEASIETQGKDGPCDILASLGTPCGVVTDEMISEADKHPLGSARNPVRADSVRGSYDYMNRLRCPDERKLKFQRIGSFGLGPFGNIIDGYGYECSNDLKGTIHIDMYHPGHIESRPVPGLLIKGQV